MIISHKYKFIFIKTRKTAGTTIEYNISNYLGNNDIITPSNQSVYLSQNYIYETKISNFLKKINLNKISNKFKSKFSEHTHAIDIKKKINKNFFDSYFKFCVEREPVDKCISYYFMRKNSSSSTTIKQNMTWDDFVKKKRFPVDSKMYSYGNKLLVDKIIKYENLDNELSEILKDRGINNFKIKKSFNNTSRGLDPEVTLDQKKIIYDSFKSSLRFIHY